MSRIYSDLAVIGLDRGVATVLEVFGDLTVADLAERTGLELHDATVSRPTRR